MIEKQIEVLKSLREKDEQRLAKQIDDAQRKAENRVQSDMAKYCPRVLYTIESRHANRKPFCCASRAKQLQNEIHLSRTEMVRSFAVI